ncbi:hypothetical protein ASPWEDRAFT_39846 [Aspergillus wentii DTO 134E9]|uniref:DUF2293 domain-containing protein n=1 Tax=Aspergillus wentii DTO 134E9 TaxID=1073089 RepID=A0A1L9RIL4_ASPWE|nr:uncharacterized protein ASPWEDRAFT_39846 [Aspergillus wentii DTO 134E9]KAI9932273.1 hypothetical protein MW887_009784 [Aspergillus wentii]OJJ34766.1 hypothetical protein ASPWEDRAFT_39846 [Aspergillus wentii DTO 134E9]
MTPTRKKPARKRASKKHAGRRKNGVKKTVPRSPQSILTQSRRSSICKARIRDDLLAVAGSNKGQPLSKSGRPAWKYSKFVMIPASNDEPFEENCFERDPIPEDYVFVPKGNVYVTRHCRSKTKESQRVVYLVYHSSGKRTLGIRVPSEIHSDVLQSAAATADSRANAVKVRDERDHTRYRQLLHTQFPLMPADSLEIVLDHAFLKGSGRVGRTTMKSDERKAALAVEAHIRHVHTPYESLLDDGMDRNEARKAVWGTVKAIKTAWEGGGSQTMDLLTLGSRMDVDSDTPEVVDLESPEESPEVIELDSAEEDELEI